MIQETGEVVDNGYYEIYVNAEIDDGTTLSDYMKLLKSLKVEAPLDFRVSAMQLGITKKERGEVRCVRLWKSMRKKK